MFANAHFRGPDDPPFEPGDFLGYGDYAQRKAEFERQKVLDQRELVRLNRLMSGTIQEEQVPDWAK